MHWSRKYVILGGSILVLAAGGVGVAIATGGDDEEQATGPGADRAKQAAIDSVGGGQVVGVERDDGNAAWEVEVKKGDGSTVEVSLGENYKRVGVETDDESSDQGGSESTDDSR